MRYQHRFKENRHRAVRMLQDVKISEKERWQKEGGFQPLDNLDTVIYVKNE